MEKPPTPSSAEAGGAHHGTPATGPTTAKASKRGYSDMSSSNQKLEAVYDTQGAAQEDVQLSKASKNKVLIRGFYSGDARQEGDLGELAFCSNFYLRGYTTADGTHFETSEHHFQYLKAQHLGKREVMAKILKEQRPHSAKYLGGKQSMPLTPAEQAKWNLVAVDAMREVIKCKFNPHNNWEMAAKLVGTGDAKLEEWSGLFKGQYKDRKWGTGASAEGGTGENWLGKILMEVRDMLNKYMAEM